MDAAHVKIHKYKVRHLAGEVPILTTIMEIDSIIRNEIPEEVRTMEERRLVLAMDRVFHATCDLFVSIPSLPDINPDAT